MSWRFWRVAAGCPTFVSSHSGANLLSASRIFGRESRVTAIRRSGLRRFGERVAEVIVELVVDAVVSQLR
ncbi:MAG: hypothetical protein K0Q61_326 [Rhodococcus erythropolis]|nr:hypothetical protein [Rhodococcus erythropolis]